MQGPLNESPENVNVGVRPEREQTTSTSLTASTEEIYYVDVSDITQIIMLADAYSASAMLTDNMFFFKKCLPRALKRSKFITTFFKGQWNRGSIILRPEVCGPLYELTKHFSVGYFSIFLHEVFDVDPVKLGHSIQQYLAINSSGTLHSSYAKEEDDVDNVELQGLFTVEHKLDQDSRNFIESFKKDLDPVIKLTEKASTVADKISGGYDYASQGLSDITGVFKSVVTSIIPETVLDAAGDIILPVLLCYFSHRGKDHNFYRMLALGTYFYLLGKDSINKAALNALAVGTVFYWLYPTSNPEDSEEVVELQNGDVFAFSSLLVSYFAIYNIERKHIHDLLSGLRASKDLPATFELIVGFFKTCANIISTNVLGYGIFEDTVIEFEALDAEYRDIFLKANSGSLAYSHIQYDKINNLVSGYKTFITSKSTRGDAHIKQLALQRIRNLEAVQKAMGAFLVDPTGKRQEPVTICISAPPGRYKSTIRDETVDFCLRTSKGSDADFVFKNKKNYVFTRTTDEFWDGWNSLTEVLSFDDFGQLRDSASNPNPNYLDLIKAYNTSPFPLNMSAVEDKGAHYFKAKWIVMTSNNITDFHVNSLISEEALMRRMDLVVTPIPVEKYRKEDGTLDVEHPDLKIEEYSHLPIANLSLDTFLYKVVKVNTKILGISKGSILTGEEYRSAIENLYEFKTALFEAERATYNKKNGIAEELQSGFYLDSLRPRTSTPCDMKHFYKMLRKCRTQEDFNDYIEVFCRENISVQQLLLSRGVCLPLYETYNIPGLESFIRYFFERYNHVPFELLNAWIYYTIVHLNINYSDEELKSLSSNVWTYNFFLNFSFKDFEMKEGDWTYTLDVEGRCLEAEDRQRLIDDYNSLPQRLLRFFTTPSFTRTLLLCAVAVGGCSVLGNTLRRSLAMCGTAIAAFTGELQGKDYQSSFLKKPKSHTSVQKGRTSRVSLQGGDLGCLSLSRSLNANVFDISVVNDDYVVDLGSGTFVNDMDFLFPLHFIDSIKDFKTNCGDGYIVLSHASKYGKEIPISDFFSNMLSYDVNGEHLAIARLKCMAYSKKNLLKYFVTENDVKHLPSVDLSVMVYLNSSGKIPYISTAKLDKLDFSVIKMARGIHYSADTRKGDCGVPIYVRDPRLAARRILGFHVAGSTRTCSSRNAYACLVTREIIEKLVLDLNANVELQDGEASKATIIGPSPNGHFHSPYNVTAIVASPLQQSSYGEPPKVPARCLVRGDYDPYQRALSKLYHRPLNVDERAYELALNDLDSFLSPGEIHIAEEIVPFREALYGNDLIPNRVSIPASTSAGYPFKYSDREVKKRILPERPDICQFTYDKIEKEVLEVINDANLGIRRDWYYLLSLKDETRVPGKDPRLFAGTSFTLLVVKKMLFGPFVEWFNTDCIAKENASTLNPYTDWNLLARFLCQDEDFKNFVVDSSDYSGFDASHCERVLLVPLYVIQSWFAKQGYTAYAKARTTIYKEVHMSKHVVFGNTVQWNSGLPSGSYLTLLVNSLCNQFAIRYAYYKLVNPKTMFNDSVRLVVLGDDNIYTAVKDIRDKFYPSAIAVVLKDLGYKLTSDSKGALGNWRTINEVSFLKRSFRYTNRGYLGPLSLETLDNTVCWTKKGPLYMKIFNDSIKFFFRELSFHDPEIFKERSRRMNECLTSISFDGLPDRYQTQHYWMCQVLDLPSFTLELL